MHFRFVVSRFADKYKIVKKVGHQEFEIPKNVLDLVYTQTLCWYVGQFTGKLHSIFKGLREGWLAPWERLQTCHSQRPGRFCDHKDILVTLQCFFSKNESVARFCWENEEATVPNFTNKSKLRIVRNVVEKEQEHLDFVLLFGRLGAFFSPLIPPITVIKMFFFFYVKKVSTGVLLSKMFLLADIPIWCRRRFLQHQLVAFSWQWRAAVLPTIGMAFPKGFNPANRLMATFCL